MTQPRARTVEPCGHCGFPQRGYGNANGIPLCHPNMGLDCYRLVTIYKHPMPCPHCRDVQTLRQDRI